MKTAKILSRSIIRDGETVLVLPSLSPLLSQAHNKINLLFVTKPGSNHLPGISDTFN